MVAGLPREKISCFFFCLGLTGMAIVVVCETHKEINGVQFLRKSDQNGLYYGIRLFSCLFYYMYRVKKIR